MVDDVKDVKGYKEDLRILGMAPRCCATAAPVGLGCQGNQIKVNTATSVISASGLHKYYTLAGWPMA